jgi:hypothetical protein
MLHKRTLVMFMCPSGRLNKLALVWGISVLSFTSLAKMIGIFWCILMAESVRLLVKNTNL